MDETGFQMGVASTTKVFFFFFRVIYLATRGRHIVPVEYYGPWDTGNDCLTLVRLILDCRYTWPI